MTKRRRTKYQGVQYDEDADTYSYVLRDGTINPKTGRPRQTRKGGFERAIDARDAREEVLRAVRKGTHAAPSKATVAELFELDLKLQLDNGWLRATTVDQYRRQFDLHPGPAFGGMRAQDLRASQLDALYGRMLSNGLAPSTVKQVHNMLSGVFKRAAKRGDVAVNPCQRATPPASSTAETPSWDIPDSRAFFAHDVVRADPDFALWWILGATGLRRGEGLALTADDVDLDAGVVNVRRNVVLVGKDVVIGEPKTKRSRRRVKIGPATVKVLRDHLARQREHRLTMGAGWHDHGLVFPAVDGRPRNPSTVSRRFERLVARTGLPRVSLHALRHAHASLLLDQGERIHDVAARLGHDPAVLLRIYAHASGDSQDSAAALESLLDGARPPLRVLPQPTGPDAAAAAAESTRT